MLSSLHSIATVSVLADLVLTVHRLWTREGRGRTRRRMGGGVGMGMARVHAIDAVVDFYPHNMDKADTHPYLTKLPQAITEMHQPTGSFPSNR